MSSSNADPMVVKRRARKAKKKRLRALERTRERLEEEKKARVCITCPISLVCESLNLRTRAFEADQLKYPMFDCNDCKKRFIDTSGNWAPGVLEVPRYCKIVERAKEILADEHIPGVPGALRSFYNFRSRCPQCQKARDRHSNRKGKRKKRR